LVQTISPEVSGPSSSPSRLTSKTKSELASKNVEPIMPPDLFWWCTPIVAAPVTAAQDGNAFHEQRHGLLLVHVDAGQDAGDGIDHDQLVSFSRSF
jgi:hypothetical protein